MTENTLSKSLLINNSFLFVLSLIISFLCKGFSIFFLPLFLSGLILYFNRKSVLNAFKRPSVMAIAFYISIFFFYWYHFVGFDFIGNLLHKDLIYYGVLSDFIGKYKIESTHISPFDVIQNKLQWNVYHYTEIWMSGLIGNLFHIPSIKVLLCLTYPIFTIIAFENLKSLLAQLKIEIAESKLITSIFIFFILLAWLGFLLCRISLLKNYISFNEYLDSGYLKLIIAAPLVLHSIVFFLLETRTITHHLSFFSCSFFYPTLIPFSIGLYICFHLYLLIKKKSKIFQLKKFWFILTIILTGVFLYPESASTIKIDIVRLGIPSIIILYFYKNIQTLKFIEVYIFILFCAFSLNLIGSILCSINPEIAFFSHIDFFQTWSNFTTLMAFSTVLILTIYKFTTINNYPPFLIIPMFILTPMIISNARNIESYCESKISYTKNSPKNYFIVINNQELPKLTKWNYDLVYMLISNKMSSFVWQNQNFFLINLIDLKSQSKSPNGSYYRTEVNQNKQYLNSPNVLKKLQYTHPVLIPLEI